MRLVLASASARRRELLTAAGVSFVVDPADVDERRHPNEPPVEYVRRVAAAKARASRARHPGDVVLGADTVVLVDDVLLAKPATRDEAAAMLARLSGRAHDVLTGVAIEWPAGTRSHVERTRVWFAPIAAGQIQWYVETGEPMDKAGAYAIQGLASRFVTRIEGSYSNVVGLPVAAVLQFLGEIGLDLGTQPAESAEHARSRG
jgi:septum formation protein